MKKEVTKPAKKRLELKKTTIVKFENNQLDKFKGGIDTKNGGGNQSADTNCTVIILE